MQAELQELAELDYLLQNALKEQSVCNSASAIAIVDEFVHNLMALRKQKLTNLIDK